ncbi:hypothetical protein KI688_012653 [Linnemannia hyalina]|uniref:Uncharacterized protein n=1 Tax=Linnemannia hyalina TaxID=64524 RepID=A0A9P8BS54_9FUNG|nr:hypothetical protein KI688_012653 [Linnemannia hyalina]
MLSTFLPTLFALILVSLSTSTLALTLPRLTPRYDSLISTRASFETYTAHPKLFTTPATTPSDSKAETNHLPVYKVTKSQFEGILRQTFHIDFRLQVVSDSNKQADENENASEEREVLGEIPVQITIHNLRLGGLSAPQVHSQTLNGQRGPINYGNIRT